MAVIKSISVISKQFGGLYIGMDTVEKPSSKGQAVGPAIMERYFAAVQAGKLSPDDDRLARFPGVLDVSRMKSVYIGVIPRSLDGSPRENSWLIARRCAVWRHKVSRASPNPCISKPSS